MSIIKSISSFIHMLHLPKPDYEVYCREKRLERYEKYGGYVHNLRLHSFANRFLVPMMKAELYLKGIRLSVFRDDRKRAKRPVIFCPTHIGGVDIEMSFIAIKTPCWLLLGDPRELYKNINGMMLQMNGWIPMDVLHKRDRIAAKAKMKALLQKGGNLLLFPEGTQNISPNALVGYLYAGAVDLAITCGAEIVPIAIGKDENRYIFSIGENISYDGCAFSDRFHLADELRDRMAALEWEIIEQLPAIKRSEIPKNAYDDYIKNILTLNTEYTFTAEDIKAEAFHPKHLTEPTEAFAFMNNLIPRCENAFLFNKRLSDNHLCMAGPFIRSDET